MATSRKAQTGAADPLIQTLADQDHVRWYSKPNLRYLYLMLFPTCMGIELTSGFDSQMINALQIVPAWQTCKSLKAEYTCWHVGIRSSNTNIPRLRQSSRWRVHWRTQGSYCRCILAWCGAFASFYWRHKRETWSKMVHLWRFCHHGRRFHYPGVLGKW
jgi:hypothetical protein